MLLELPFKFQVKNSALKFLCLFLCYIFSVGCIKVSILLWFCGRVVFKFTQMLTPLSWHCWCTAGKGGVDIYLTDTWQAAEPPESEEERKCCVAVAHIRAPCVGADPWRWPPLVFTSVDVPLYKCSTNPNHWALGHKYDTWSVCLADSRDASHWTFLDCITWCTAGMMKHHHVSCFLKYKQEAFTKERSCVSTFEGWTTSVVEFRFYLKLTLTHESTRYYSRKCMN